jgi:hypothetical protein
VGLVDTVYCTCLHSSTLKFQSSAIEVIANLVKGILPNFKRSTILTASSGHFDAGYERKNPALKQFTKAH